MKNTKRLKEKHKSKKTKLSKLARGIIQGLKEAIEYAKKNKN